MKIRTSLSLSIAATAMAAFTSLATSSNAQEQLLAIEFNQDDQDDFDIWPTDLIGGPSESIAEFATSAGATSGTTTVTITSNTTLNIPGNRGSLNGTPEGYSYQNLYEDLLHAGSPTGFITFDFSGLLPNKAYRFTLYAWDPGATDASDKEWTVTDGTADPSVLSVNFQDALIDNETFALVYDITTTEAGTFQVTNTAGLPQSAVNGFKLDSLEPAEPLTITAIDYSPADKMLTLTWDSLEGVIYAVKFSNDMTSWLADLDDGVMGEAGSTTKTFDLSETGIVDTDKLFLRVEIPPLPAVE